MRNFAQLKYPIAFYYISFQTKDNKSYVFATKFTCVPQNVFMNMCSKIVEKISWTKCISTFKSLGKKFFFIHAKKSDATIYSM